MDNVLELLQSRQKLIFSLARQMRLDPAEVYSDVSLKMFQRAALAALPTDPLPLASYFWRCVRSCLMSSARQQTMRDHRYPLLADMPNRVDDRAHAQQDMRERIEAVMRTQNEDGKKLLGVMLEHFSGGSARSVVRAIATHYGITMREAETKLRTLRDRAANVDYCPV